MDADDKKNSLDSKKLYLFSVITVTETVILLTKQSIMQSTFIYI